MMMDLRGGGVVQWLACLIRNRSIVSSNPTKIYRCFFREENFTRIA